MVVPQTHNQHHSSLHGLAHCLHASFVGERLGLSKHFLLIATVLGIDGVVGSQSRNIGLGKLYFFAILDVEPSDVFQLSIVSVVNSDELSDNGHGFGCIDFVVGARPVEIFIAVSEGVQITAIFVADSVLSLRTISALLSRASVIAWNGAGVGGVGVGLFVGFPHIEFCATSSIFALVILPVFTVSLSPNELHVVGALGIAIPSSVLGSSFVGGVFGGPSIRLHFHKVKCAIDAALKGGQIDIESKLFIGEMEHFVFVFAFEEVDS